MSKSSKRFGKKSIVFFIISFLVIGGGLIAIFRWVYFWTNFENPCFVAAIGIEKDDQFAREGFSGTGTINDPYRLENLELTVDGIGISICHTEAYFIITNCIISGGYNLLNIEVVKTGTAKIVNNTFICDYWWCSALSIYNSPGTTIANNTFLNGSQNPVSDKDFGGVNIIESDNCTIKNNIFIKLNSGISIYDTDFSLIENNFFISNFEGLAAYDLDFLQVFDNYFINNSITSAYLFEVRYSSFQNNSLINNTQGFNILQSFNITIRFNQIENTTVYGIRLETSSNITIYENNFIDNHLNGTALNYSQAYELFEETNHNYWYEPLYQIGNYWSDLIWNSTINYMIDPGSTSDLYPLENPVSI